ncbi:MAG: HNH endonuclease signature motif containing protein [Gordonia sp. (in: high G+C Gram-positive bacteria)]
MNAHDLVVFADQLSDDLTDPPDAAGGVAGSFAEFFADAGPGDDDYELLAVIAALLRVRTIADHALARAAAAADRVRLPARKQVRTVANLLIEMGAVPAVGHRTARLAAALSSVPEVARGMRDGAVPAELGDAVVSGVGFVGKRVALDDDDRARVVASLMVQTTPKAVKDKAREWALKLAPDEADADRVPPEEDVELNELTLVQTEEGRVSVTVDFDVVAGEELVTALDPLCRPVPEPDGSSDRRSAARRRADALAQVVRTYLAGSERPTSGGVLPHVTLVVPAGVAGMSGGGDGALGSSEGGTAGTGLDAGSAGLGTVPVFGFGGAVSARTAGLVMCEASVCAALVDADGVPLSVGREKRLFPPGVRKALVIRDRGCAFPGCGAPASWCDAHHVEHWEHGGQTSLGNGVMLCRRHHTLIHHGGWEVFIGHDRHPWFLPPADPADLAHPGRVREPMRSHGRRTLTALPGAA